MAQITVGKLESFHHPFDVSTVLQQVFDSDQVDLRAEEVVHNDAPLPQRHGVIADDVSDAETL